MAATLTIARPAHAGRARLVPPPGRTAMTAPPAAFPYVVGVDLSLTATGIAWPDRTQVYGKKGLTTLPLGAREHHLKCLAEELGVLCWGRDGTDPRWTASGPDGYPALVVLENLPTTKTAGGVVSTEKGYVWHELVRMLHQHRIPVLDVAPSVIKKYATGKGNANKGAVIEATARRMPWLTTNGDDNACDAAWAMAIGCDLLGQPIVEVPKVHRDALAKLTLPQGVRGA